jgi:hypothetical protein
LHPKNREEIEKLKGKLINMLEQDQKARKGYAEILQKQGVTQDYHKE